MADETILNSQEENLPQEDAGPSRPVESLDYVLRDRSFRNRVFAIIRATPWWIVSIALHMAAVLFLGKMVLTERPKPPEDLVYTTEIRVDELKPLDLKKIEQIFKQIDKVKTDHIIEAPVLVQETQVDTHQVDFSEMDIAASAEPAEEAAGEGDFTDISSEGDGGDMDVGAIEETSVLGVGDQAFNPRGLGSYRGVIEHLTVRIGQQAKKFRGNVLLVWLIDASVSMKDDQAAVKEHLYSMDKKFREKEGGGNLIQALVYFGDKPYLWLKPTEDVEKVMEAFDHIEPIEPGTSENVMSSVIYCAKTFRNFERGKKILVLVDDDSSDDTLIMETAIAELRKSKMTLYVINRQCPFQSEWLREPFEYKDAQGEIWKGLGRVHRGPETAKPEIPEIIDLGFGGLTQWSRGEIMSGFGIYDQSRLAYYTGGAYYILDTNPEKEKENLAMYDWQLMEAYRPELCSRAEYDARTVQNPFKQAIMEITEHWAKGAFPATNMPYEGIGPNLKAAEDKVELASKLIRVMEDRVIIPADKLEKIKQNRRWPANADLLCSFLNLARYRLRQYVLCMRNFLKENPKIPPENQIRGGGGQKPLMTKEEAEDRAECIKAMRALADRHPRTPWGRVAAMFDPNTFNDLYGYQFEHYYSFPAFWALIEFRSGQRLEAYVTDRRNGAVSIQTNKGNRTVPEKEIRKITPIQKQGDGGGGGGGGGGGRPADPRI